MDNAPIPQKAIMTAGIKTLDAGIAEDASERESEQ
jgi:hypothetical protein